MNRKLEPRPRPGLRCKVCNHEGTHTAYLARVKTRFCARDGKGRWHVHSEHGARPGVEVTLLIACGSCGNALPVSASDLEAVRRKPPATKPLKRP